MKASRIDTAQEVKIDYVKLGRKHITKVISLTEEEGLQEYILQLIYLLLLLKTLVRLFMTVQPLLLAVQLPLQQILTCVIETKKGKAVALASSTPFLLTPVHPVPRISVPLRRFQNPIPCMVSPSHCPSQLLISCTLITFMSYSCGRNPASDAVYWDIKFCEKGKIVLSICLETFSLDFYLF